jgi:hypothetical protein
MDLAVSLVSQGLGEKEWKSARLLLVSVQFSCILSSYDKLRLKPYWHEAPTATVGCLSSSDINTMQSIRRGAGTPTPQALQVPGAESPRAQPSQGREPTQTIEITGVLNHRYLHIFGANNTLGPENRYCSRGPA